MDETVLLRLNREQLHHLAERYAADAGLLLEHGRWSSAYYLAGYAVECALKACIARQFKQHDFPDRSLVQAAHTHEFEKLLGLAPGLKERLEEDSKAREDLKEYWKLVTGWRETARYKEQIEARARDLIRAVSDTENGVLTWLKEHW